MNERLLIATHNAGKLRELRALLAELPVEFCNLDSFPEIAPIAETGATFAENASLKAIGYATQAGLITIADDSGLEVAALGGAPGVRSARYAGNGASDADRIEKLLSELANVADRRARFVSVIAISDSCGRILNISSGICEGAIAEAPSGTNGFGYDPIFVPDGSDSTFAELPAEIKNKISHRAQALKGSAEFIRCLTLR